MKYLKHFENPNALQYNNKTIDWAFAETYVFSYYGSDELFIMEGAYTHADLLIDIYERGKISEDTFNKYEGDFNDYYSRGECSGRLFVKNDGKPFNIISFWRFPEDNEEMKKLSQDIKEKTGIDIWNDEWKVEIIKDKDIEKYTKGKSVWVTDDVDYIPVKEYKKSEKRSEEEMKIPHLMNWKEKQELKKKGWGRGWGSDMTAWDSKNPLQWRQAKYVESLQYIKSFKLFENPDYLGTIINGEEVLLHVSDGYSVSFTTDSKNEHLVVAFKPNQYHYEMQEDYTKKGLPTPSGSAKSKCSGRLWVDYKVISFWIAPENKEELQRFIKEMDQELRDKKHIGENETIFDGTWYVEKENEEAQKLEDFAGIKFKEEEYAVHLLSWEEKQRLKREKGWGRGWGSDMTAWDGPNPLWWRQAKYQENKTFDSLDYDRSDYLLPTEYTMDLNLMFISHELEGIIIASNTENSEEVLFFNEEDLIPDVIKRSTMTLDVLDNVEELIRYFKSHFDDSYPIINCILKGGHVAKCEKEFYVEFYDIDEIQKIIDQITSAIKRDKDLIEMITIKKESDKFNI